MQKDKWTFEAFVFAAGFVGFFGGVVLVLILIDRWQGVLAVPFVGIALIVLSFKISDHRDAAGQKTIEAPHSISSSMPQIRDHSVNSNYQAYLQSPTWKANRADAVRRAGNRCQLCKSRGPLEVHHNSYADIGNERPEDLIVLCRSCHEVFHQNRKLTRN